MFWHFITRWRRVLIGACIPLLAFLSLTAGVRHADGGFGALPAVVSSVAAPFQGAAAAAYSFFGGLGETFFGGARLRSENEELRREVARLRQEVQESRERVADAARYERLLGFREQSGFRMIPAGVIGHDAAALYRTILLDRGATDGLRQNQAVLSPEGVVGRIMRVYPQSALVLLLADRSSGIDAIVQRTRDQGVVQGLGGDVCELKYLPRQAEVEVGDYIVTSGMDGVFPKGVWIGQVSRVQKGGYLFQSVEVRPTAALDRLEEVWVATDLPGEHQR